ncbi:ComF family protein [Nonomuraea sp. NPDC002799]
MLVSVLSAVLDVVLDVVLPQTCAGCGAGGARLCGNCVAALTVAPARRMPVPAPPGLPECWSAAPYDGAVRRALVSYKERGAVALAGVLAEAMAFTAVTALGRTGGLEGLEGHGGIAVVPVPSAGRSRRVRGHDPVGRLAVLAAWHLRASGVRAEPWAVLRQRRRVADQAGLSATQRVANLAGSLWVDRRAPRPPVACALLLDDIVTTGATLLEAARALRSAGMPVPLAVTAAATRRRS